MNLRFYQRAFLTFLVFLFMPFFSCWAIAPIELPSKGNFVLPISQQPGPFISFGQNILSRGQIQVFLFADKYAGNDKHNIDFIPSVLYGITDNFSLFVNVPYALSYQYGPNKSTGFEDAFAQLEYAFYTRTTDKFLDLATIVFNAAAPTGSAQKNPPTGNGSPTFFLGATYNRTYVNWFYFLSPGVNLTTAKNGNKVGNSYLYQGGFGRNIVSTQGWLLAWVLEGDGTYSQKSSRNGSLDANSGGNVLYVTPSFWASTEKFIFQLGAGWAVTQQLNGSQNRNTYLLAADVGWQQN